MSLSNTVFVFDEFKGFWSAGNESNGRVLKTNQNVDSVSSSATLSCMKDSNDAVIDVEVEGTEKVEERISLCLGYDWVNHKLRDFFSRYRSSSTLSVFLSKIYINSPNAIEEIISFRRAGAVDNVCESHNCEFFYFYECYFTNLHVRFPLNEFQMGVLKYLNIAPTQLHPNGWDSMQAFSILGKFLSLSPSPKVFLYYYSSQPGNRPGWLSLISKSKICFLKPFTFSYKNFK